MHQIHNSENYFKWQKKGRKNTIKIKSNTGRRRLNIVGGVNLINQEITVLTTESNCDKNLMKVFLKEVKKDYPNADKIIIYLDNASYQRNYEVQEEAKKLNILLKYLPPYAPNLSLIERIWKYFKKKIIKSKYYETFEEFHGKIDKFFKNWNLYKKDIKKLLTLNFEIIN